MSDLGREQAILKELIGFCARLLDVKKPIKLTIGPDHPFAMAAVRKLRNGGEVEDVSEDYDEIEIFIYENKKLRAQFDETQNTILLLSEIVHELVHIRHEDWDEQAVADEEARITRLILKYMEHHP